MNALQVIEAEDPKAFLRRQKPSRELLLICPIQGREDEYKDEEGAYRIFSAVDIEPADASKLPSYFEQVERTLTRATYDAADLYITELLSLLRDKGIRTLEVWTFWPNETAINPYQEAEDPKHVLRSIAQEKYPRFSADISKPKIWASDDYFINLAKPEEEWAAGEFCPILIRQDGSGDAMDGMYGLSCDVSEVVGENNDDAYVAGMDQYEGPIWSAIENGITSGTLDGIVGPRRWRIVYYPDAHRNWNAANAVPVEANRQYGEQLGRDEALEVANRVLEGEDPKSVFRKMGGRENAVTVDMFRHNEAGTNEPAGQVMIRPNGEIVPGTPNLERILHELGASRIQSIYRDLQRGRLNNTLWRTRWGWHVHGVEHYGGAPDHPAIRHMVINKPPELIVTTRNWTVRLPIYADTRPGHGWQLIFDTQHLNRSQRKFFDHYGEMIWYSMNEGPGFEGAFYRDEDEEEQHPIAEWRVEGNPELAVETDQDIGWGFNEAD